MITFILNNKDVTTDKPAGTILLDFIRYHKNLTGTKIGCREGDCGACTVLVGELKQDELQYRSFTSCLTPLGNVAGKHVVTIEGVNMEGLNPIQQAMVEESATQCGFCTPGFVVSLAGFCLSGKTPDASNAIAAVDGNICRCTGYKSIERAAARVAQLLQERNGEEPATFVARKNILPAYFATIREHVQALAVTANGKPEAAPEGAYMVGGGTDLYVQKHDHMPTAAVNLLYDKAALNGIYQEENRCVIGAAATVTDFGEAAVLQAAFPDLKKHLRLISSTPIRNMATIAGNLVNASPIGDFSIMLLALDAMVVLSNGQSERELPLRQFYKSYKVLAKQPNEYIARIWFELPQPHTKFNFEKVSKRTHLDIASVNSAISFTLQGDTVQELHLSAGGVGPVPKDLAKTAAFLSGKVITEAVVAAAQDIAQTEISPISDARGTATYKRLLLNQLIKAHLLPQATKV